MDASCCYVLNQDIYCFLKAMHTCCTIDLLSLHVSVHPSATSRAQLAGNSPIMEKRGRVCHTKPDKYYTTVLHTASAPLQM